MREKDEVIRRHQLRDSTAVHGIDDELDGSTTVVELASLLQDIP
jgi:hypothetical protein